MSMISNNNSYTDDDIWNKIYEIWEPVFSKENIPHNLIIKKYCVQMMVTYFYLTNYN